MLSLSSAFSYEIEVFYGLYSHDPPDFYYNGQVPTLSCNMIKIRQILLFNVHGRFHVV